MSVASAEEFDSTLPGVEAEAEDGVSEEEMTVAEDSMAEEGEEQMPEAEATQPPQGYIPQKDLDNLRSQKDKEIADERRQRLAIEQELKGALAEREQTELALLDEKTANMTEEQAEIAKGRYEVQKERRALEAEKRATKMIEALNKKDEYASYLATQHGVPKAELMDADSPQEMERLAQKISKYYRQAAKNKRAEAGTDRLDSGPTGRGGTGTFRDAERAYAQGRISDAQYVAARRRAVARGEINE